MAGNRSSPSSLGFLFFNVHYERIWGEWLLFAGVWLMLGASLFQPLVATREGAIELRPC